MNISRRWFLKTSIKGATIVSGIGLSNMLKVVADDTAFGRSNSSANDPAFNNASRSAVQTEGPESSKTNEPAVSEIVKPVSLKPPPIKGQVIAAGAPGYDESRKNYNGRFDIAPKFIFYCQNENDVVQAVQWAQAEKQKVSIRSGGHSYEAFSLLQDGSVIDLSKMTNVQIDPGKKIATVAAGTTLLPLYEALWQKRVVVPGGSCATVGVAGLTLGGGFGLLSRRMGLACDNLLALKMVDATGKILVADAKNNSELLWACRGGGAGNFGVVTQLTFKLHPIGNVTIVKLRWNWQDMKTVIQAWQDWAPNTDDRFTSVLTLSSKSADHLMFLGLFLGSPAQANALIQPLLKAAKPIRDSIESSSFIDAARRFSGFKRATTAPTSQSLPETVHMPAHPRFKNTSDYVNADLNAGAIDTIIKFLSDSPIKSSCVQFDGYGGAIARVPAQDSAFCHRAATKFCMHYQASWGRAADDAKNIEWIDSFRGAMQPFVSGFAYANYCDRSIEDWPHRYFGNNLDRLNTIKSKYDPEGFFSYPQGLPGNSI